MLSTITITVPVPDITRKLARCEGITGYRFRQELLAAQALNASGDSTLYLASSSGKGISVPKNDRLAVYGKAVSSAYLCGLWFETDLPKADWNGILTKSLNNRRLAQAGFRHGLDDCVIRNAGTPKVSDAMMATAVEAILGAVHKDGGDEALGNVIARLLLSEHAVFRG